MDQFSPAEQVALSDAAYKPITDFKVWAANVQDNEALVTDVARDFGLARSLVDEAEAQEVLSDAIGGPSVGFVGG